MGMLSEEFSCSFFLYSHALEKQLACFAFFGYQTQYVVKVMH